MKALDLPLFNISRLIIVISSWSRSFFWKKEEKDSLIILNSPSTIHFLKLGPTILWSTLDPDNKFKAANITDLPAPVSPVKTENPSPNFIERSSIKT